MMALQLRGIVMMPLLYAVEGQLCLKKIKKSLCLFYLSAHKAELQDMADINPIESKFAIITLT